MKKLFAILSITAVLGSFSLVYAASNSWDACYKYCSRAYAGDQIKIAVCMDGCTAPIR